MGFIKTMKLNFEYLRIVNSCNWTDYRGFIGKIIEYDNAFTKKTYVWNLLRGKTFYKGIEKYIDIKVKQLDTDEHKEDTMGQIERLIHQVITTEKNDTAIRSFVWGLTRAVPILTIDIIKYINQERIRHILMSDKPILNDDAISGFVDVVMELRRDVDNLTRTNEALTMMISDD